MDLLDQLLEHDQWATTQSLEFCRDLTDAQLDQEFDIGHRTLRGTFAHMIHNIDFWTDLMLGKPRTGEPEDAAVDRSLAALRAKHERSYPAFAARLRSIRDEGRLAEVFVDHYNVRKTFSGTAIMITQHNAEHRTEILHIATRLGLPDVPELDYGLWEFYQLNNA